MRYLTLREVEKWNKDAVIKEKLRALIVKYKIRPFTIEHFLGASSKFRY